VADLLAEVKKLTYTKGDPIPTLQAILNIASVKFGTEEFGAVQPLLLELGADVDELLKLGKDQANVDRITKFIEKLDSFNVLTLPPYVIANLKFPELKRHLISIKGHTEESIRAMLKAPQSEKFTDLVNYLESLRSIKTIVADMKNTQLTQDYEKEKTKALDEIEKKIDAIISTGSNTEIYLASLEFTRKIKNSPPPDVDGSEVSKCNSLSKKFTDTAIIKMYTRVFHRNTSAGTPSERGHTLIQLEAAIREIPEGFKVSDYEAKILNSLLISFRAYLTEAETEFYKRCVYRKGSAWSSMKSEHEGYLRRIERINTSLEKFGFGPRFADAITWMTTYNSTN